MDEQDSLHDALTNEMVDQDVAHNKLATKLENVRKELDEFAIGRGHCKKDLEFGRQNKRLLN